MSAVPPAPTFRWRQAVLALVVVELALLGLYYDTARAMVEIWWRSGTFNHAFLVPPISLWLIWEKRHILAQTAPRPTLWLTLPLALIAFGWLMGELVAVNVVTQFALVAMGVLAVPLVIGLAAARRIAFPLGFLFFAVPFGEFVMPTMMDWTAKFIVLGLRATGIPVYQEGLHFVIPSGRWSVVEACSGVRYLIASIVVGTLFAYLNYRSMKHRLVFVGVAIVVPLIANWLRAYMIVMLGHLSGNTLAVGVDHLIYGWMFFGAVMLIMFAVGLRWRESDLSAPAGAVGGMAQEKPAARLRQGMIAALLTIAVALAPRAALLWLDSGPVLPPPQLSAATLAVNGWQLAEAPLTDWQPAFASPSATLDVTLAKDGQRVGVFIAWYQQQNYERKLISSENVLVKSSNQNWAQLAHGTQAVMWGERQVVMRTGTLRRIDTGLTTEAERLRVWHGYWIDGRIVSSDVLGKVWLALMRLAGRGDASAALFVYASEPGADAALAQYLAETDRGIERLLTEAAASRR